MKPLWPISLLLACLALALPGRLGAAQPGDDTALRELNAGYVKAFLKSDLAFYQDLLTDDFQAVLADGRLIGRKEFLANAALPPKIHDFRLSDVAIRLYDTSAVVTAWVSYKHEDDTESRTRYSDLYVKVGGKWKLASVQWTRIAPLGAKP